MINNEYELLDSGEERKLERFGDVVLSRPCGQAAWEKQRPEMWASAVASFDREHGWRTLGDAELPTRWIVTINGIVMKLKPSTSGHLGVFPETRLLWDWIGHAVQPLRGGRTSVLNLFAHTGGATLAAARVGGSVCHVDASRSMVQRAKENAGLNQLDDAPIRWIVEDVGKFLDREIRRGRRYDAIMLDPPSFGHGSKGEQYRIERDLSLTLGQCKAVLSERPAFVLLTSHTRGVTKEQLESLVCDVLDCGDISSGEMELTGASDVRPVNGGVWARWTPS